MLQSTLVEGNKQKCGYAAVADLATGQQRVLHLLVCHLHLFSLDCALPIVITAYLCRTPPA